MTAPAAPSPAPAAPAPAAPAPALPAARLADACRRALDALTRDPARASRLALALIVAVSLLRLAVAAGLGLGDAEAYYWLWSRHLRWTYFDHPAGIALLLRATTALLGDSSLGVRVGPVLCFAGTAWLLFDLTRRLFSPRAAFVALALVFTTPLFALGAVAAAPDAPLAFAWSLYLWGLWRVVEGGVRTQGRALGAAALGLVLGAGFLTKYFMVLLAPMTVALLVARRELRPWLRHPAFFAAAALAAAVALPIVFHEPGTGGASVAFHLRERHGHLAVTGRTLGQLLGGHVGVVTPFLLVLYLWACREAWRRGVSSSGPRDARWAFLALMSAPVLAFFYAVGLVSKEFEPHWPALGYLPLTAALGALLCEAASWATSTRAGRRTTVAAFALPLGALALLHVHLFTPLFVALVPEPPYRAKYDLANELRGWPEAGARVRALLDAAPDAHVLAYHYTMCSQLAHALGDGTGRVRCVNTRNDGFDFLGLGELPPGASAVYVADLRYTREPLDVYRFDACTEAPPLRLERGGKTARAFRFWTCTGFGGLRPDVTRL